MLISMPFLIFIFWLLVCFSAALLITNKVATFKTSAVRFFTLNLAIGLGSFILLAHLIAGVLQSYALATKITCFIFVILAILSILKIRSIKSFFSEIGGSGVLPWLSAATLAILMYYRDQLFSSSDRIHIALIASVANNDIYPPLSSAGKNLSMSDYHFGTDLIGASIKTITGLISFDAISLQIALGVGFGFLAMYTLAEFYLKDKSLSVYASLIIFFYTSINSLEFFFREFPKLFQSNMILFLNSWLMASWTSISHNTSQMRLPSQNIAIGLVFVLITLILLYLESKDKSILYPILPVSFLLCFCYPSFWYPLLSACFIVVCCDYVYHKMKVIQGVSLLGFIYIGKVLCFNHSTGVNDSISTFILKPSLEWVNWGKSYLSYFYSPNYLMNLGKSYDPVTASYLLSIPLFSSISFRDFGFSAILASILFIRKFINKESNYFDLIYITACISLSVPFFIQFILRPVETTRFILVAKLLFVFYAFVLLFQLVHEKLNNRKLVKLALALLSIPLMIPGIVSIIPYQPFGILGIKSLNNLDKSRVKALEKLHHSGEVVLDPKAFEIGSQLSGLAGFYSVGGQFDKADTKTIDTAMKTINPILLHELEVTRVLVYSDTILSDLAQTRLNDPILFKLINLPPQQELKVYEFLVRDLNTIDQTPYQGEFVWALGYPDVNSFKLMQSSDRQWFIAATKQELAEAERQFKKQLAKDYPIQAFWLNRQAILASEIKAMGN